MLTAKKLLIAGSLILSMFMIVILVTSNIIPSCDSQIATYQARLNKDGKIRPPKFVALSACPKDVQDKY